MKGSDFMATSSFTKEFIIGEEEAVKLAELLEADEPKKENKKQAKIVYADKEFIKECFM